MRDMNDQTPAPDQTNAAVSPQELLELGRDVLRVEAQAIAGLVDRLGSSFLESLQLLLHCRGRVVVSGIGKSGHVARKIAATLASTGTPAFFVHPAEASHGDLGMITPDDVVIALSNSGESAELVAIVPIIKRRGTKLISITGTPNSTLATQADAHIEGRVEKEACPLGLAPTSSTTAALALGDALALALLKARGFSAEDFALSHPGGKLGKRLLVRVSDVMHSGAQLPVVGPESTLAEALIEMSAKGLGMTAVADRENNILGIFTDGDLRRRLGQISDIRNVRIDSLMKTNPRTIHRDRLAAEAVKMMESQRINGFLVVDDQERLVGALNTHDLFRAGVM